MDSKLKCVFVMPDNNIVTSNGAASSLDHAKPDPYHSVSSSVSAPPKPLAASSSPKVKEADSLFSVICSRKIWTRIFLTASRKNC